MEAVDVRVRRGPRTVLDGVDLALEAGEAGELAGANGSGKTSLLRVLAGLAAPAGGHVTVAGGCAFVPERIALAPVLRPGEWLAAMRRLRGLAAHDFRSAAADSGLDPGVLDTPSATLSRGMLQRIALLEAVAAGSGVLLLDEPFSGLDAGAREWLATRLAEVAGAGAAVLFTDHTAASDSLMTVHRRWRLAGGRCAEGATAAGTPPGAVRVRVHATHPDGRRLDRTVGADASDDLLRELLAGGWHVDRVDA